LCVRHDERSRMIDDWNVSSRDLPVHSGSQAGRSDRQRADVKPWNHVPCKTVLASLRAATRS